MAFDISEIRARYDTGEYNYKNEKIPKKLPADYIFDEELSVKCNRELVIEHNQRSDEIARANRAGQAALYKQLHDDIIEYLKDSYGFTDRQAHIIESFTYAEKHSFMSDYFSGIDTFAEFAEQVLSARE
jgi:hypothetical protein